MGGQNDTREFGAKLKEFEPVLFEPKTKVERFMLKANHQFHNCLPYLQERLAADLAGELDHE